MMTTTATKGGIFAGRPALMALFAAALLCLLPVPTASAQAGARQGSPGPQATRAVKVTIPMAPRSVSPAPSAQRVAAPAPRGAASPKAPPVARVASPQVQPALQVGLQAPAGPASLTSGVQHTPMLERSPTAAFAPRQVAWETTTVIAQAGEAPKQIHVDLLVIHASNDTKGYDAKVARFKKQLSFLSYTGFSLLNEEGFDLNMGETHRTSLFEGRVVETTLVSGTDQKVRLKIKLSEPSGGDALVDTKVNVPRKGTFFVGGPKYKGGVLILPVTATY